MRLQLAGRTAADITADTGELLPHLLTLAPKLVRGGYFLLRYHTLASIFRQEVQCSVLSGLSSVKKNSDRTTDCGAKIRQKTTV